MKDAIFDWRVVGERAYGACALFEGRHVQQYAERCAFVFKDSTIFLATYFTQ